MEIEKISDFFSPFFPFFVEKDMNVLLCNPLTTLQGNNQGIVVLFFRSQICDWSGPDPPSDMPLDDTSVFALYSHKCL